MDRRLFLGTGAAFAGSSSARAAPSNAGQGPTVVDFGVRLNVPADQSAALQSAVNELSSRGLPVILPPGRISSSTVVLPSGTTILGTPGLSILAGATETPVFDAQASENINLRGLTFSGTAFRGRECRNVTVADCEIIGSAGDGFVCAGRGLFVGTVRAQGCGGAAIWVEGDGMVTGNTVSGPGLYGLRLGGSNRLGTLTVINNRIEGPSVGIAASNSPDGHALIVMNMILGAKLGGVRALNGDTLTGKDLTRGGSEAFPALTVGANVSL